MQLDAGKMWCCYFGSEVDGESIPVAVQQVALLDDPNSLSVDRCDIGQESCQVFMVNTDHRRSWYILTAQFYKVQNIPGSPVEHRISLISHASPRFFLY